MAIQENGNISRTGLQEIAYLSRVGMNWARNNPGWAISYGIIGGFIFTLPAGTILISQRDEPVRRAEADHRASVQATATAIEIASIARDYKETGGLDPRRLKESFYFTQRGRPD